MNESVKLDTDQMTELVSAVSDSIFERFDKKEAEAATLAAEKLATEEADAAEKIANDDGKKKAEQGVMPTAKEIAAELAINMGTQTKENADKLYNTMFSEKLVSSESSIPGLTEFLDGNDDYGNVRREQLLGIDDYANRVTALGTLSSAYKEASAGSTGGKTPTVSKEVQKKVADNETRYKEVNDKFEKGEYTNTADFTNDFMAAFAKEAASLTGQ